MTWLRLLAVALAASWALAAPAHARIQSQMFCWAPDSEFPVACDEDAEEADDDDMKVRKTGSDPLPPRVRFHHRRCPGV